MASFSCKKCGSTIPVLQEWLIHGINKIIQCETCGKKMRLNLAASKPGEQKGTVILGSNSGLPVPERFIIKSKETFDFYITNRDQKYTIKFGRNPTVSTNAHNQNLLINDPYISREHGVFTIFKSRGEMKITLEDLGSSNGTSVNGNRVNSGDIVYVNIGDAILAGNTIIKVQ